MKNGWLWSLQLLWSSAQPPKLQKFTSPTSTQKAHSFWVLQLSWDSPNIQGLLKPSKALKFPKSFSIQAPPRFQRPNTQVIQTISTWKLQEPQVQTSTGGAYVIRTCKILQNLAKQYKKPWSFWNYLLCAFVCFAWVVRRLIYRF